MAAISIVSGTSLNAFFHPRENLQSIAIQCTWRQANLELLSCIAKNRVILPEGWKNGAELMSTPVTGMGRDGMKGSHGEGGSFLPWMSGQAGFFWGDTFTPDLPPAPRQQEQRQRSGRSPGLWHSSQVCWKSIAIPTALWLDSLYCQLEEQGRPTKSLDILGISGFIRSDNVWIDVLSDDS